MSKPITAVQQAQNTMAAMTNQLRQDSADFINAQYDAIVSVNENAKIPEPVFRHHFLPHFTGQQDPNPKRNVLAEWVGVAGTAMSRVDVISEETGKVLFVVPPIMDSNIIDLNKVGGRRLGDLISEFNLHRMNGLPGADAQYMANVIQPRINQITSGESGQEKVASEWDGVFKYYGLTEKNGTATTQVKKVEDNGSDDLVYE